MQEISIEQARQLAVRSALLDGQQTLNHGKEGIIEALGQTGYIQIDTISVVERAHHHALYNRVPGYRPEMLNDLLAHDRRIFEYWAHAACYLPITDFRYFLPTMQRHRTMGGWAERMMKDETELLTLILHRIREEGPLSSKDFERPAGSEARTWWSWKPAKAALELLFWQGELMITARKNFQRVYDLAERVLPPSVDTSTPTQEEVGRFLVRRALQAFGVATMRDVREYMYNIDKPAAVKALKEMTAAGEIVELRVSGLEKNTFYAFPETLEQHLESPEGKVHLLSPFDLLVIHRQRTLDLFGFDYRIECYTPQAKRKYGYFVLPILWGDRLVGRLDAKAERKAKKLLVHTLYLEPNFTEIEELKPALLAELQAYTAFTGCAQWSISATVPPGFKDFISSCTE